MGRTEALQLTSPFVTGHKGLPEHLALTVGAGKTRISLGGGIVHDVVRRGVAPWRLVETLHSPEYTQ